jgi:hypothetical protein
VPSSLAHQQFQKSLASARILASFAGQPCAGHAQDVCDQTCMMAAIASAVGAWEGYLEAVLVEFVAKTRVQAHARAWPLIAQFEVMVHKATSDLNTPNWDKSRELLIRISGVDPYASWIWAPKFASQTDTKDFFDGLMSVRHAFAHGFSVPSNVRALGNTSGLTIQYVGDVLDCLTFFSITTDGLLEHELKHKHDCRSGW